MGIIVMENNIYERLGKIVQLAKYGVDGERDSALRIVSKICKEKGLDFNDVMALEEQTHKYAFKYNNSAEEVILGQILRRYGITDAHPNIMFSKYRKVLYIECTAAKYVNIIYIYNIYIKDGVKIFKKDGDIVSDSHLREQHELLGQLNRIGYKAVFAVGFEAAVREIDQYLLGK